MEYVKLEHFSKIDKYLVNSNCICFNDPAAISFQMIFK